MISHSSTLAQAVCIIFITLLIISGLFALWNIGYAVLEVVKKLWELRQLGKSGKPGKK